MSVYFATCRQANAVKIGSSIDPHGRLCEIQLGCPMLVIIEAVMAGNCEDEFAFHRRFEDDRIRGEWFTITPMIEAIIAANPAPAPRPKVGRLPSSSGRPAPWEASRCRRDRKRYAAAMAETRTEREAARIRKDLE